MAGDGHRNLYFGGMWQAQLLVHRHDVHLGGQVLGFAQEESKTDVAELYNRPKEDSGAYAVYYVSSQEEIKNAKAEIITIWAVERGLGGNDLHHNPNGLEDSFQLYLGIVGTPTVGWDR